MSTPRLEIREREPGDGERLRAFLAERSAERVARRGQLVEALEHPALIAERGDELVVEAAPRSRSLAALQPEIPLEGTYRLEIRDELGLGLP